MDILHLKYFIEVARQKNFSKAADAHHVSQSAISKMVKDLERELGATLLNRNSKSVQLTDAGHIFYHQADQIVGLFNNLTAEFDNQAKLERGKLLIGLPPITAAFVFAKLLGEFRKRYPRIDIELYEYGSKKVQPAIQEGTLDFGMICHLPDPSYEYISLPPDPLKVIMHADHPLADWPKIEMKDLANEQFVIYREDFSLHDKIMAQCLAAGFQPKIIFQTSQRELMVQTVASSLGIAFLPGQLCADFNHDLIRSIPLVNPEIKYQLSVIWKKGRHLSYAAKLWLEFAKEHFVIHRENPDEE